MPTFLQLSAPDRVYNDCLLQNNFKPKLYIQYTRLFSFYTVIYILRNFPRSCSRGGSVPRPVDLKRGATDVLPNRLRTCFMPGVVFVRQDVARPAQVPLYLGTVLRLIASPPFLSFADGRQSGGRLHTPGVGGSAADGSLATTSGSCSSPYCGRSALRSSATSGMSTAGCYLYSEQPAVCFAQSSGHPLRFGDLQPVSTSPLWASRPGDL